MRLIDNIREQLNATGVDHINYCQARFDKEHLFPAEEFYMVEDREDIVVKVHYERVNDQVLATVNTYKLANTENYKVVKKEDA